MQVSIIIPTKDRGSVFDEALQSVIKAIEGLDAEVIVINDSKTSSPNIPSVWNNVILVHNPKSGVASARNLGASMSQAEILLFMDDDFIIPPDSIVRALKVAAHDSLKIHLFNWIYPPTLHQSLTQFQFGRYLVAHGFTSVQGWLGEEWRDDVVFELKDGASYFLPIRKSIFTAVGGYNENFPHAGAEDYDFVQRAKDKGVRFYLDKSCTLYHNESDRIELKNWLRRKERNGETLQMAVSFGHKELALNYSIHKRIFMGVLSKAKPILFWFLKFIPNVKKFDKLYFSITSLLLSTYLFDGYSKKISRQ